jgi:outer membrane lipoprotein SlyB
MERLLIGCVSLVALLGIAGCAQVSTNATGSAAAVAHPSASREGTILSMRPVTLRSNRAPWSIALLATASGAMAVGDDASRELTEFIVRTDAGSTISIVQTNELGFRPGDRILVLHDDHTHIARPG